MKFILISRNSKAPENNKNTIHLKKDNWNDYSYVTTFHMSVYDQNGDFHNIGATKIGFKGQTTSISTFEKLDKIFEELGEEFFSLGQDVDFYIRMAALPRGLGKEILHALRDVVQQPHIINEVKNEKVFGTSLLRGVSLSVVKGQFVRVLEGRPKLSDFRFKFSRPETEELGEISLSFNVKMSSTPSTNIHAVIGRNGVGKTTLLNGMISAITTKNGVGKFFDTANWSESEIPEDYFSSLVSVSFSAFDPFTPPKEQPDPAKGTCYFYIGLKDPKDRKRHRTIHDLQDDCAKSLVACFHNPKKCHRWIRAISSLGSDENFHSMNLSQLESIYRELKATNRNQVQSDSNAFRSKYLEAIRPLLDSMSSGHAVVLLTITGLVATVEEKTLVLLDEPESHLHPPLLAALVRTLADLLHEQNGVAIIATHSPVVLQEIPSSCVWKIYRTGGSIIPSRPTIETFAENVGFLTSEVFSLEVERSGFHELLGKSVKGGGTYNDIVMEYNDQLGFEGRAILKALIAERDRSISHDAAE